MSDDTPRTPGEFLQELGEVFVEEDVVSEETIQDWRETFDGGIDPDEFEKTLQRTIEDLASAGNDGDQ